MSLFVRLLDEIDDAGRPVSAVLLKARRLAEEMPGRKFKAWVQVEMGGYRDTQVPVPDYRKVGTQCVGNFIGPGGKFIDFPLPLGEFSPDFQDKMSRCDVLDGVGTLEGFLGVDRENLCVPVHGKMIEYFQRFPVAGTPMFTALVEAYQLLPRVSLQGVLYAVRTRLLEFLLRLGKDFPDLKADDGALARVKEGRVEALVQRLIIEGDYAEVNVFQAGQQVRANDVSVGGNFVVSDEVGDSFNRGGQPE